MLVTIDNPQLQTKLKEAEAARVVALADLKRVEVGTRAEVIAGRRAALAAAEANARLAEQTYDRTKQLTARARPCELDLAHRPGAAACPRRRRRQDAHAGWRGRDRDREGRLRLISRPEHTTGAPCQSITKVSICNDCSGSAQGILSHRRGGRAGA